MNYCVKEFMGDVAKRVNHDFALGFMVHFDNFGNPEICSRFGVNLSAQNVTRLVEAISTQQYEKDIERFIKIVHVFVLEQIMEVL